MIKVSIITPSFNQAPFLKQCIESVLNQDYPNIEYIIIDGGSNDGSVDIIKQFEDNIAYWISEADEGQSHAINKGFEKASGEIIAWLNSDDLYFPDAVSTAVKRFEENQNLSLFYGNCVFIDKEGAFLRYFTETESYNKHRLLNYSDYIMQPTTFFKRKHWKNVGKLDESLHFTMDWDLWCKLCTQGEVFYEYKLIAANRDYAITKTNIGGTKRLKEIWFINKRHRTSLWPNSFFSYTSAEIRTRSLRIKNSFLKKIGFWLSFFVFCMSPMAVYYGFKNKSGRYLYGFEPNTYNIPNGEAHIYIPFINSFSIIHIEFNESNSKIIVNGQKVENNYIEIITNKEPITNNIHIKSKNNDQITIKKLEFIL